MSLLLVGLVMLLSAGAVNNAPMVPLADESWGKVSETEWSTGAPADYPHANAIVLFDRGYELIDQKKDETYFQRVFERHVRMKALNAAGADEIRTFHFDRFAKCELSNIRAHTIKPDGTIHESGKDEYSNRELDHWWYRATIDFPQVDSGSIVEVTYRTSWTGIPNVPSRWYFQHTQYTLESSYTLETGVGAAFEFIPDNLDTLEHPATQYDIELSGGNSRKAYAWRLTNLAPVPAKSGIDCLEDRMASMKFFCREYRANDTIKAPGPIAATIAKRGYFQSTDDWDLLIHMLGTGWERSRADSAEIGEAIKQIVGDLSRVREKTMAIYRFVTDSVATDPQEYGMRFTSKTAGEILKARRGTAWEKNWLLLEMLGRLDIDARPILICTRDHPRFDPGWPIFQQFTHVLVMTRLDRQPVYLDASVAGSRFGELPPVCRPDTGLLVDHGKTELIPIASVYVDPE